jgi:hypothetical protein
MTPIAVVSTVHVRRPLATSILEYFRLWEGVTG